jgi:hypothetical protein
MIRRLLGELWRSERGSTVTYVALTLPVLFGAAALTIDLGRGLTLNTELQQAADAAALAGAAELNGQTGARSRATTAAQGAFGTNSQTYASGGGAVTISAITFLSSIGATDPPLLPPNGTAAGDVAATSDADAAFIKVQATQRSVATTFINVTARLIPGAPNESAITTTAFAVAGFKQFACTDFALLICAPTGGITLTSGIQVDAKEHGASWTPGAFGLVVGPGGQGAAAGARYLASASAGNGSCRPSSFQVQNGSVTSEYTGLNTRFDLYGSPHFNSPQDKTTYPPARNVTKGYTVSGKAVCNQQPDPTHAKALPRDSCFPNSCPNGRFGNGSWDRAGYWAVNHGTTLPAALTSASRYATYRYEIDNGLIPQPVAPATTHEFGVPKCSPATPNDNPDRRVMNVAIVDCSSGSLTGTVRPIALMRGFITEPALAPPNDDFWIEVISITGPNDSTNQLKNVVQLYR